MPSYTPQSAHSNLVHGTPVPAPRTQKHWNIEKVAKRDGRMVPFEQEKVVNAIFRAARAVGGNDKNEAQRLSDVVCRRIEESEKKFPTVEEIQDIVEKVLIDEGHATTAKAYILYRAKRAELRSAANEASKGDDKEKSALLHMFAHKSKLASLLGYDRIEAYKNILFYLKTMQKTGKLATHPEGNYLGNNELATTIYQKKYYLKTLEGNRLEKRPEDVFARLAAFMASVEPDEKRQQVHAEDFYKILYEGYFMPGGRVLAGSGDLYRLKTLANCFVSVIEEDNLESIYKAAYECARTYSYGGGIGVDITTLRPAGSVVHNAADESTGAVSFMELYSLTTGLIGQSGRRGALMLTLDIKHPDSPLFVKAKKNPNWVTRQILEQCKMSGKFSVDQMTEIERQVRENTQVRSANISLKMNDEFMRAVEEQNEHGGEAILVYEKDKSVSSLGISQGGEVNYSYGIPSKPIERYTLRGTFTSISELNAFLAEQGCGSLTHDILGDAGRRDMFGDYLVASPRSDSDFAIKYSGDFMLYFNSAQTGEVKRLVKARELWNAFVEGNYRTAEPGLLFWTRMSSMSPSNYAGRPIASTNPCVTGDTLVSTVDGLLPISELVGKQPLLLLDGGRVGEAARVWQTGIKPTYTLTTREGFVLKATADHRIQTPSGWKTLAELQEGEKVVVGKLEGMYGRNGTYEEGLTLGWLAGDGHYNAKNDGRSILYFYGDDKQECLPALREAVTCSTGRELTPIHSGASINLRSQGITNLAVRYGVCEGRFPVNVLQMGRECQRGFLRALFTADGSIQGTAKKGFSVRLTSVDIDALHKTQLMLLSFGIYSVIYQNRRPAMTRPLPDGHGGRKEYFCKAQHDLMISSASLYVYAKEIGFLSKQKQDRINASTASFVRGPYKERFEAAIESIQASGEEPVYDLTEPQTHSFVANGIVVHNCGEIPLEDGGACNLGSINLSRFVRNPYVEGASIDWDGMAKTAAVATRFLDNVVTWNETLNPLEKQRRAAKETRRLGIGVMGIADMLNELGMGYDSEEGIAVIERVMSFIANAVYRASADIAQEKGSSPIFDYETYSRGEFFQKSLNEETREIVRQKGLRNIALLSIAPTGSISNIVLSYQFGAKNFIGVSSGVEPIFSLYYTRRSESFHNQMFKVFHSTVSAYIEQNNLQDRVEHAGDMDELKRILPTHFFRTAHFIAPDKRVEIQGVCQQYIDHSISSTVNLPEDIEPEVISNIYLDAWRTGLKGITIYREGSRFAILSTVGEKSAIEEYKNNVYKWDGKEVKGDDVIVLPSGRLTTVFHALHYGWMKADEVKNLHIVEGAEKMDVTPREKVEQLVVTAAVSTAAVLENEIRIAESVAEEEEQDAIMDSTVPDMEAQIQFTPTGLTFAKNEPDVREQVEAKPHASLISAQMQLYTCPACQEQTLKMDNGCNACINESCGYGQCEV
ncbi:MAG: hypothetical protein HYV65_00775 [Candidatus Spechtbacteria bacterium]|nr:hypothetical protein [Candidatus Spechtbacteria bacterium]